METALTLHRLHFAFTVTFHYIFPQLTMGLALLLVILNTAARSTRNPQRAALYDDATRFWARIFGINFAIGVVTGIPMEFQFGTNWAAFSQASGGVIGQPLAMEGVFAFFLESSFLGLFLYGEKRLGPALHWFSGILLFAGSWLSGYFIVAADAWMQHPVGFSRDAAGNFTLQSVTALLGNPWLFWQYLHTMLGAVLTGGTVVASLGAFYLLLDTHAEHARIFVRVGLVAAFCASVLLLFPTGDRQGANVARNQPATLAAMEGLFETENGAPIAILGQPDMQKKRLDNPLLVPRMLSFLTYQRWKAQVEGLDKVPIESWPDNIPLLYFSYHIMVGLGTILIALLALAVWNLSRGVLFQSRLWLWVLLVLLPFPYIANTAGWMTAELGRQPWLIYGLMRTSQGASYNVSAGNTLFTLIGFMGLYALLGILFLFLISREIERGPAPQGQTES